MRTTSPLEHAIALLLGGKKGSFYLREMCSDLAAMLPKNMLNEINSNPHDGEENPELFASNLTLLIKRGTIAEQAGLSAMLIGMMDVAMVGKSTQEDWDKVLKTKMKILNRAKEEGRSSITDAMQQEIGLIPFRAKEWMYHIEEWNVIYENHLSAKAIREWMRVNLAAERSKKQQQD